MRNIFSILLFIIGIVTTAQAQIAFEAGLNMGNLNIESDGTKVPTKFRPSGAVGIVGDIRMNDHIFFQPGLFYKGEGCIIKTGDEEVVINTTTLNLNFEYKTGEKCGNRFLFGIGPYVSIINNVNYGGLNYLNQLDLGPAVNVGFLKKKHLYIRLSYQLGLVNLLDGGDNKNYIKSSAIGATLGYLIGGCRERGYRGGGAGSNNHWRGLRKNHYSTKERNYNPKWLY